MAEKAAPQRTNAIIAELRGLYAMAGLSPADEEGPLVVGVGAASEATPTAAPGPEQSAVAADAEVEEEHRTPTAVPPSGKHIWTPWRANRGFAES